QLDRREAALEERLAELDRRERELAEADARSSELDRRERELAQLAARTRESEAERVDLGDAAAAPAAQEQELWARAEDADRARQRAVDALEARAAALAEDAAGIEARRRGLDEQEHALAVRTTASEQLEARAAEALRERED